MTISVPTQPECNCAGRYAHPDLSHDEASYRSDVRALKAEARTIYDRIQPAMERAKAGHAGRQDRDAINHVAIQLRWLHADFLARWGRS